jgi:hypothetical protein
MTYKIHYLPLALDDLMYPSKQFYRSCLRVVRGKNTSAPAPPPLNRSFLFFRGKRLFDGYFKHEGRYIWYYIITLDVKKSVTVFLDEELRMREQKDYLDRIENRVSDYSLDTFHDKQHRLGTIAIIENTGKPACEVYADYKTRGDVETMIDALKNIVEADRSYMQNEQALEGWMFINLIALKWYYSILNLLKKNGLNKKYSPADFLSFLSEVKKVKINNQWHDAEITKKTQLLLQSLNILRKIEKS